MLIGADYYWDIVENEIIRGDGPTAVKSKLGYLLSGPIHNNTSRDSNERICNVITSHVPDETALERFWSLESMGITSSISDPKFADTLEQYQQTSIEYTDGRYCAKLPWKLDHPPLPSNYEITMRRTESTIARLRRRTESTKEIWRNHR